MYKCNLFVLYKYIVSSISIEIEDPFDRGDIDTIYFSRHYNRSLS